MLLTLLLVPAVFSFPQNQFENFPTVNQERPNRDILYDEFLEEAINLSPADREERQVELTLPQQDDFFTEEELDENLRHERDGVHGHRNGGARGGRRQQDSFSAPAPAPVEPRGGRQTGGTAPALGLLNNPPNENGDYNFNFSTDDGARREEQGRVGAVQGSYSFISPEGEQFSVSYTADETGFHPSGLPPMPAHVQRTLDHLAKVNGK